MRYFLCLIPPLAVLLCGKPFQAVLAFILTLCFYVPGVIYALIVVSSHKADKRADKIVKAIDRNRI